MQLTVSYDFLPKRPSSHAAIVMDHFGIGFETGRHVIAEGLELPVRPGDVVLFTGPSGSGKSSLLRAAAKELRAERPEARAGESRVERPEARAGELPSGSASPALDSGLLTLDSLIDIDSLALGERILVDALSGPIDETLRLLASCGLGEAQLLLRTPGELSEGQRYRFRLALAISQRPRWIVADEFSAT
ncbi:MAG: ATP-binding cassette domain-containing protein, partial [Planctomycetaceae bacterium]